MVKEKNNAYHRIRLGARYGWRRHGLWKRDECWNVRLKLSHEHLCNFVFMVIQLKRKEKYQHEILGLSGIPLTCYQGREGSQRDLEKKMTDIELCPWSGVQILRGSLWDMLFTGLLVSQTPLTSRSFVHGLPLETGMTPRSPSLRTH